MILVDFHVHLYHCFNPDAFLDAAFDNFQKAAFAGGGQESGFEGVLCLAGTTKSSVRFTELFKQADVENNNGIFKKWRLSPTDEHESVCVRSGENRKLFIVAARQIETAERLEVLAIGTDREFQNNISIFELSGAILESGAIPVLPWGFGKWTGRRKNLVGKIAGSNSSVFLSDSAGRPLLFDRLSVLRKLLAQSCGPLLNGTDPLPITGQEKIPGRFGVCFHQRLNEKMPWEQIKTEISSNGKSVPYGKHEGISRVLINQVRLRI